MGFLFGEPKIQGDELRECLVYYEEELKLKVFQEKEADLYNNAVVKYGRSISTDSYAAKEMCRAANRLAQSASEILRRRKKMAPIPNAASAMYFAWQLTYSDYSAWATAQSAAIEAVASGMEPHGERVKELLSQSEKSRHEAEKEEKKLLKRLKLNSDAAQKLFNNASAAIAAENWQPEGVLDENAEIIPKKIKETYKELDKEKQEVLFKAKKVFEGLSERDSALMIAANIGIIACPTRLSTRLESYRRIMAELDSMLTQAGISAIDDVLGAERTLLKQAWWDKFVDGWKEKWAIRDEKDIGFWGLRHKKLQPYIYEFGYFYQTPADYKDKGSLKLPASVGYIGPRKIISWRVDIKSNSVTPIIQPVSNQLEKGLVLASRGSNEEAVFEFNRYIKMKPNDPMAYVVRGDSYDDMGQFEKAIEDYSKSIELEPMLAEAYDKRGTAYAQLGDFEKAIRAFNKAIGLYPENAMYYFNMSVAYNRLGDTDETIANCTKAIELDENFAKAFYNRGLAYSEKGEYDKAISDCNKAIKLQPEFIVDVYFNRGVAYQAKGEYKKALEDFKWVRKNVTDREDIEVVEQRIRELTSR